MKFNQTSNGNLLVEVDPEKTRLFGILDSPITGLKEILVQRQLKTTTDDN